MLRSVSDDLCIVKSLLRIIFTITLRLRVEGTENIPKDGPLVIASNHLSLLDPPVLGTAATRKVHFMAKQELFVPILGDIYRLLGAFPVRRGGADRAAIKHGIDILMHDQGFGYFPRKVPVVKQVSWARQSRGR